MELDSNSRDLACLRLWDNQLTCMISVRTGAALPACNRCSSGVTKADRLKDRQSWISLPILTGSLLHSIHPLTGEIQAELGSLQQPTIPMAIVEPVERGDTGPTGQPRKPRISVPLRQGVDRVQRQQRSRVVAARVTSISLVCQSAKCRKPVPPTDAEGEKRTTPCGLKTVRLRFCQVTGQVWLRMRVAERGRQIRLSKTGMA